MFSQELGKQNIHNYEAMIHSSWATKTDLHSFNNFTEDNMSAIQPVCLDGGYEKLWAVCVSTSVSLGENTYKQ